MHINGVFQCTWFSRHKVLHEIWSFSDVVLLLLLTAQLTLNYMNKGFIKGLCHTWRVCAQLFPVMSVLKGGLRGYPVRSDRCQRAQTVWLSKFTTPLGAHGAGQEVPWVSRTGVKGCKINALTPTRGQWRSGCFGFFRLKNKTDRKVFSVIVPVKKQTNIWSWIPQMLCALFIYGETDLE